MRQASRRCSPSGATSSSSSRAVATLHRMMAMVLVLRPMHHQAAATGGHSPSPRVKHPLMARHSQEAPRVAAVVAQGVTVGGEAGVAGVRHSKGSTRHRREQGPAAVHMLARSTTQECLTPGS